MNLKELKVEMLRNSDNGSNLAEALGITTTTLSRKMHGEKAEFTRGEMDIIKTRYNLTAERMDTIFFGNDLS